MAWVTPKIPRPDPLTRNSYLLLQAVIEARATMSAAELAQALGISRARVYAIAAGRE